MALEGYAELPDKKPVSDDPDVRVGLKMLQEHLERLQHQVGRLGERLVPVRRPMDKLQQGEKLQAVEEPMSPIGIELRTASRRVQEAANDLGDILGDLQV